MKVRAAFNLMVGLATLVGALPLMAQSDSEGEADCIKQCDTGAVCCSTAPGGALCCSYNTHQCCFSNLTTCHTASC